MCKVLINRMLYDVNIFNVNFYLIHFQGDIRLPQLR